MSEYPTGPGAKEGATSAEAARAIKADAVRLRKQVLDAITRLPRTADEIAAALGLSILSVRPRLSELRAANLIEPTGERRKNASGASAHVWRAKKLEGVRNA